MTTLTNDDAIAALLRSARNIAVIGASTSPSRPSHDIGLYLIAAGYNVIPVNPHHREVFGRPCYARLQDVPDRIDIVDCFRRSEDMAEVARDAVEAGAAALWMQFGTSNAEAAEIANEAGLDVVDNRCIKIEHRRMATR